MKNKKIILVGAGNVAYHLASALLKAGMNLCQIYSRHIESARELGMKTGVAYTTDIFNVYPDGDIYIFCVSDDALSAILKNMKISKTAIAVHTSGCLPMDIFQPYASYYGVLYPLQTFSKKRDLNFKEIPLCIEASETKTLEVLSKLGASLSLKVERISSEKRRILHLSAVFANNFVNHFYAISAQILKKEGLDFNLLHPLILETAHKIMLMQPEQAQTGPAKRGDESILNIHKTMLKDEQKLLNLYVQLSDSIQSSVREIVECEKVESDNKPLMQTLW